MDAAWMYLKIQTKLFRGCYCKFTVIRVLFLRKNYTVYGTSRFGYVWTLFKDMFSARIMTAFRRLVMGI